MADQGGPQNMGKRSMNRTSTLSRLMGRSRSGARIQSVIKPYWMTEELIRETQEAVWSSSEPRELLRSQNMTMQTDLKVWTMLRELSLKIASNAEAQDDENYEEHDLEQPIFEYIEQQQEYHRKRNGIHYDWMRIHDPVGSLPLHQCFLLGMSGLGKKMVERFYNTPTLVSLPYKSDFDIWKDVGVLGEGDSVDDGGLYTGETVLHIAIVSGDLETACWLLERGIDIGARACGAFFSPEVLRTEVDKQPSISQRLMAWVQDRDLKNDPIVVTTSNPDGACYYGEYPLSFAASMGNIDACNILVGEFKRRLANHDIYLAKLYDYLAGMKTEEGREMCSFIKRTNSSKRMDHYSDDDLQNHAAFKDGQSHDFFISAQDSQGNTALHMAVLHGNKEVVDWIISQKGGKLSLELLNNDGFTPLTLAARMGSVNMFHHVLGCMRETVWSYGNLHMTKTSLLQIDTYRVAEQPLHMRPKWRSALDIIVRHEIEAFSGDELFNKLINDKWDRFGRNMYIWRTFVPYCLILGLFSIMLTLKCDTIRRDWNNDTSDAAAIGGPAFSLDREYGSSVSITVLQTLLVLVSVPWLIIMGWRMRRLGPKDYDPNEDGDISPQELMFFVFKNSSFFLDYMSSCTICIAYGLAFSSELYFQRLELQMWAVTAILLWCNFLNVIMPFEFFGILVIIIYKMLIGDFFKFFAIYLVMIAAFSQAIFCLFQLPDFSADVKGMDKDPGQAFLKLVWVSLGDVDFQNVIDQTKDPPLTLTIYMIWVMLSTVLLINLLIAMMGQTFHSDMEDTHKTWIFPFSHLVLTYEKMLSADDKARLRSGHPGHTYSEDDDTDPGRPALRKEPFFEIAVEEDRQKLAQANKEVEARRANKLILERVNTYGVGMKSCIDDLRSLQQAVRAIKPY